MCKNIYSSLAYIAKKKKKETTYLGKNTRYIYSHLIKYVDIKIIYIYLTHEKVFKIKKQVIEF